jgi:hypothetical protein
VKIVTSAEEEIAETAETVETVEISETETMVTETLGVGRTSLRQSAKSIRCPQ